MKFTFRAHLTLWNATLGLLIGTALLMSAASVTAQEPAQDAAAAKEPTAADLEFFEKKIRPVLVQSCYECHSESQKTRGGLDLGTRAGWADGGDSGPAIVPGKPDESLLIEVIRYDDPLLKMPPKGKLPDAVIADFEAWVAKGAADPRTGDGSAETQSFNLETARQFWSYQLPKKSPAPAVKQSEWPAGDIDRFLLAKLEAEGLKPVVDADRGTLIRRLTFDLIGLPPTPEEIDTFTNDTSPDAYEKLVDRLLASPQFGERWGRHWLDVVRYAESVTLRGLVFEEAWRYRDYVIETFNTDRPFDRFMMEQVSGDLMPAESLEERRRQTIATAFLAMGNSNLEDQDKAKLRMDVVDEQLDTLGKTFLAQTIGCARCHDHKFDPIPHHDYYAMAGILRNTRALENSNVSRWLEFPLPLEPEREKVFAAHEAVVKEMQERIKEAKTQLAALTKKAPGAANIVAVTDLPGIVIDDLAAKKVGNWQVSQYTNQYVGKGYSHDQNEQKGEKSLTFLPEFPEAGRYEVRFAYTTGTNRATNVPVTIMSADGEQTILVNERKTPPIDGRFISLGQFQFELNGQGYVIVSNQETDGHVIADAVQFLSLDKPNDPKSAVAEKPEDPAAAEKEKELALAVKNQTAAVKDLEAELKTLEASGPKRPLYMGVEEEKEISNTHIHVRGNVHNLGAEVPRGFLQVATYGEMPTVSAGQSGRLELGEWLAREDNPLPARVMANRVWHWLFGSGIVRTTDNFGAAGELPSHPELLDYLAVRFVEEGWSVKQLVREIVMSRTYRLSTVAESAMVAADPENRLLGRMNRRRLDAECIRDTMLSIAGSLDLEMGGSLIRPGTNADYNYLHQDSRRSIYAPVFRNSLPDLFEAFDFPNPSLVSGRRNVSTVTPQALFLMNSPFVAEQAKRAAGRLLAEPDVDTDARITRAFRLTLGREPTADERSIAKNYLGSTLNDSPDAPKPSETETAWAQLYQALFSSLDFRYVK